MKAEVLARKVLPLVDAAGISASFADTSSAVSAWRASMREHGYDWNAALRQAVVTTFAAELAAAWSTMATAFDAALATLTAESGPTSTARAAVRTLDALWALARIGRVVGALESVPGDLHFRVPSARPRSRDRALFGRTAFLQQRIADGAQPALL
jgi:hypothetical protein